MGKFNLASLLDNQPQGEAKEKTERDQKKAFEVVPISVFDIVPSEENFYSVEQIQELKTAIELAGGIKQNGVVVPLGNGKYKAIAGHRRRLALISLVEEGKTEYEFFPCKIEDSEEEARVQADREELLLILTNSQRDKTDWEKMEEVRRLRAIMERNHQKGIRTKLAEALNASPASIGRLDAIAKHLITEFKEEMREKRLGVSAAYELSGLPEEEQRRVLEEYKANNGFSVKAARQKKEVPAEKQAAAGAEEPEPQLPGQLYYDGVVHDRAEEPEAPVSDKFPDGAVNQPEEEPPATLAPSTLPPHTEEVQKTPPTEKQETEVSTAAGQADHKEAAQTVEKEKPERVETRCIDSGICPHCGEKFNAEQAVNYSTQGTQFIGPVDCPHCGKPIEIFCSIEYFCSIPEE